MFEVCLFDLDDTLLRTSDLTTIREAGRNNESKKYLAQLREAYDEVGDRHLYTDKLLAKIRQEFPKLKLGVFTRAPRSYAAELLSRAFPETEWDVVVAFEDVERTKPFGEGIDKAMFSFGYKRIDRVILVGDGDNDIRAAYNAGCVVALDKSSWARSYVTDNWRSLAHMPDAIINQPDELLEVLRDHRRYLPDLEQRLSGYDSGRAAKRFDRVNKFVPREVGGDTTAYPIYACGRSFSNYKSLEWRKNWHKLTESIQENKDADAFPDEWVVSVKSFVAAHFHTRLMKRDILLAVVPHRPGRAPRLERFLQQIAQSYEEHQDHGRATIRFCDDLLAYKDGVRSNSNDKLGAIERFENIRDNLFVFNEKEAQRAVNVVLIDDVSTTGSSLIYGKRYLEGAGASEVTCLSIAMNIGNVLYD